MADWPPDPGWSAQPNVVPVGTSLPGTMASYATCTTSPDAAWSAVDLGPVSARKKVYPDWQGGASPQSRAALPSVPRSVTPIAVNEVSWRGAEKLWPQSADLTTSTASVCWPCASNWRNVMYTCPLRVTEMSGNCTSWTPALTFFGVENVAPWS